MVKKVAIILALIVILGFIVRWAGVILDLCFAVGIILFIWALLRNKKPS